jgi:hypothetical protein
LPAASVATMGAWFSNISKEPLLPGKLMRFALPENNFFVGVIISIVIVQLF